ncbi:MAG: hypothetical protein LAE24_05990 [Candidatus Contendobacter sp.]|jgi:hypothetical protein|nr:hypothetical protein [Candidatus Contendobacter sp.]
MTRSPNQAQPARRLLSQVAVQRSHRRCESIRVLPEEEPASPPPRSGENAVPPSEATAVE